ncbi:hypothetical protein BSKO_11543 [Bryopsis sp. KO-2023]|nr:hypothetical protein BSKO_11543 [Bryopsis sp. KO-2023]
MTGAIVLGNRTFARHHKFVKLSSGRKSITPSFRSSRRPRRGCRFGRGFGAELRCCAARTDYKKKTGGRSLRIREGEVRSITPRKPSDDMIPVSLKDGRIVTGLGLSLVDNITDAAFVNESESSDGDLVLGFQAKNGKTHTEDINLGQLRFERFLACARCKLWWMTPEWGTQVHQLSPETQFLLLELKEGGPYAILLPLIDAHSFRATLRPPKCRHLGQQDVVLTMESGCDDVVGGSWNSGLYMAAGWDPFTLIERGVAKAGRISGGAKPRWEKELPKSLDVFGWCTWDAFYSSVSAKGVATGVKSLCDGDTPPRWLIIDDGWQKTDHDPSHRKPVPKTEAVSENPTKETSPEAVPFLDTEELGAEPLTSPQLVASTTEVTPAESNKLEIESSSSDGKPDAPVGCFRQMTGWMWGLVEGFLVLLYQRMVDKAPPGSARVRLFTALAKGPLRNLMLHFYATAGDFSRRLVDVKANGKFSSPFAGSSLAWHNEEENLSDVISYLKQEFGVQYIYCWHGLPAYWSGVMPEEPGVAKYNSRIVYAKPTRGVLEIEPSLAWNPAVLCGMGVTDSVEDLYVDMHEYLMSAGVTGVKVDCQAGVGLIGSVLGGGSEIARRMHNALEKSTKKHFPGNHVINCMCHSTENIYRMVDTVIARASDDFYPRDPNSTTPHIANSAFNSLFLGPLVMPDWDMFQSIHPAARLHGMARAISGGAVYVSDRPGNHDFDLLKELVLSDGSVLRAQLPGRPTRDCLFRNVLKDGKTLLKVWNINLYSGIVGMFNVQGSSWDRTIREFYTHNKSPPRLESRVSPRDVENLIPMARELKDFSGQYLAYMYEGKELFVGNEDLCLSVNLESQKSEMVSFSPVLKKGDVLFGPMGLSNMMNGSAAVKSCEAEEKPTGIEVKQLEGDWKESGLGVHSLKGGCIVFITELHGSGEMLCYASMEPKDVWIGSQSIVYSYKEGTGALTFKVPNAEGLRSTVHVIF